MVKILNTSQTKSLDAATIEEGKIESIDLMERACVAFVNWFVPRFGSSKSVLVVCGTGNNGGDGAGIARLLSALGYPIKVAVVQSQQIGTLDFKKNLDRLSDSIERITLQEPGLIELPITDVIIDALFGSGLSRPLEGFYAKVVEAINSQSAIRVSVDIPSGLFADKHTSSAVVHAHYTVTFQLVKLSFLLPQYHVCVGEWSVVDIGLSKSFMDAVQTQNFYLDEAGIRKLIRPKNKFDHKGSYGHSLIVAGCLGKMGANVLATKAALRSGSGLVTSLVPKGGNIVLQSAVPEAMTISDGEENYLSVCPDLKPFDSIGIGPGIGKEKMTVALLRELLINNKVPCVIDADALNILSENPDLQKLIFPNSILTPHSGEFKRMVGGWQNDFERLELQRSLSIRLKSVVVLKGAHTSIALPNGDVYFNSTGSPAMATGGSGDVLTGILTALLAQHYTAQEAALIGVYIHGLAGDLATKNRFSIVASDIIEEIPHALKWLTFPGKAG